MRQDLDPLEVRGSSGIVRPMGFVSVFVFNTLAFALGASLAAVPSLVTASAPLVNIQLVIGVGALAALVHGYTYGLLAAAMPRSGGDYVYVSRVIGDGVGFVANWGFSVSQVFGVAVYCVWCWTLGLLPGLSLLVHAFPSPYLSQVSALLQSPLSQAVLAFAVLCLVWIVSKRGVASLTSFLISVFGLAMLGTFVMAVQLWRTDHAQFVLSFDEFMLSTHGTPGAYKQIASQVPHSPMSPFRSLLLALPFGYLAFIGVTYSAYVGGEVRRPERTQVLGMVLAAIFGYVFFAVTMGRFYAVVGQEFFAALSVMESSGSLPARVSASMSFLVAITTKNFTLNLLIALSTFLWFLGLPFVMLHVCVRNLFAWTNDGLAPRAFRKIDSQGVPAVALGAVVGASALFALLYLCADLAFTNYVLLFSISFLLTGVAAARFPFSDRCRYLFDRAPPVVKLRMESIPLIGQIPVVRSAPLLMVAGVLSCVVFALMLVAALTNEAVGGPILESLAFTAVVYSIGTVVYLYYSRSRAA